MSGNDELSATLSAILYCLLEAFLKVELLSFNKNGRLEGRLYFKGTDEILSTSNFFSYIEPTWTRDQRIRKSVSPRVDTPGSKKFSKTSLSEILTKIENILTI